MGCRLRWGVRRWANGRRDEGGSGDGGGGTA